MQFTKSPNDCGLIRLVLPPPSEKRPSQAHHLNQVQLPRSLWGLETNRHPDCTHSKRVVTAVTHGFDGGGADDSGDNSDVTIVTIC